MGLDDASLVGAPTHDKMILGSVEDLRQPESAIIDRAGYYFLFPGQPLALGKTLEVNDSRVRVVGIAEASAPFLTAPVMFARYSQAIKFVGRERDQLSFVLVKRQQGVPLLELCRRIEEQTGLRGRDWRRLRLANGSLLHQQHRDTGQLWHHHRDCFDRRHGRCRPDLLYLHH